MGKESVVAFSLAFLPLFSFLLFGERWRGNFVGIYHVVGDGRGIGSRCENVQVCAVFGVKWWLQGFCEDVCRVVDGRYSPDLHPTLHIILLDFVVADVY